jgi:hypothetical protein
MDFCQECNRLSAKGRLARRETIRRDQQQEHAKNAFRVLIARNKESLQKRLATGQKVFAFKSVYIPVDSLVMDQPVVERFDIEELSDLGLRGWNIVQAIPRTSAIALENQYLMVSSQKVFAGGLGGTVVGVYVLLRKEIIQGFESDLEDYI